MTLDEAIKILRQHNVKGTSVLRITRGQALEKDLLAQVLDSCEQLISEKAEYKRLLKAAVEDNKNVLTENFGDICQFCKHGSNPTAQCCKPHNGSGSWCCENAEWRYADEALALIGKDIDVPAAEDDTNVGRKRRIENA